jgi:hypothetical protein
MRIDFSDELTQKEDRKLQERNSQFVVIVFKSLQVLQFAYHNYRYINNYHVWGIPRAMQDFCLNDELGDIIQPLSIKYHQNCEIVTKTLIGWFATPAPIRNARIAKII